MQVTETSSEGLKRTLKIVVDAGELGEKFSTRLNTVKDQVLIKGFRRGKVPVEHLKKIYGRSIMAEVLQEAVNETSRQAVTDRKERPAFQPKIDLTEDKDEIERVFNGKGDLAYTMSFEVLPEIVPAEMKDIKLDRLTAEVTGEDIDKAVEQLVERSVSYEADAGRAAGEGDRLTIDFEGRVDGVAFEGGKGEGVNLVIGQGGFIQGFEDGLKGAKAGEQRLVKASFPAEYPVKELAGKEAVFETTVKEVAKPIRPEVNDEFAKTLGAETLTALREMVSEQIKREFEQISRQKIKRGLLDALDKAHTFPLPPTLVDGEFEGIWNQVTEGLKQRNRTFADEGKTEEAAREEYRKIAERRVRLGLLIGEIGDKNQIKVSEEELRRALIAEARRYPGQERMVYEYYEKNPDAFAQLRAPIFEDKVVDFLLELADVAPKTVSREELLKPIEE